MYYDNYAPDKRHIINDFLSFISMWTCLKRVNVIINSVFTSSLFGSGWNSWHLFLKEKKTYQVPDNGLIPNYAVFPLNNGQFFLRKITYIQKKSTIWPILRINNKKINMAKSILQQEHTNLIFYHTVLLRNKFWLSLWKFCSEPHIKVLPYQTSFQVKPFKKARNPNYPFVELFSKNVPHRSLGCTSIGTLKSTLCRILHQSVLLSEWVELF